MADWIERVKGLWDNIISAQAKTRAHFTVPSNSDHIVNDGNLGETFKAREHYFQIVINEMFLADAREWFVKYDPMTFVLCSYIYNTKTETLPFVVGPAMLKQYEQKIPVGMIFKDTPVSGMHPYQGGSLMLTVILNKLARENNADKLLRIVESVSGAFSPSVLSAGYLKIAGTVLNGVESLLGLDETIPVLGYRIVINPDTGGVLEPAYYALIDVDEDNIEKNKFWIRDRRLYWGEDPPRAKPYRENDFVLFSITQGKARHDERILPFYSLWEKAQDLAARPEPFYWQEAKANFNALKRSLLSSPDLTEPDAKRLMTAYLEGLKGLRNEAIQEGNLAGSEELSEKETEYLNVARDLNSLDNPN
jgi:hypothetical protein